MFPEKIQKKMTKYAFFWKLFTRYDLLGNFELSHILGWESATLSFDRYKTAQSLQWRSCILCFETVLGMNKITPTPSPPPKNKKIFQKIVFILMIFLKNLFKGVGLATLSFNKYSMAQGFLGRSCLKYLNIIKKLPLSQHPS